MRIANGLVAKGMPIVGVPKTIDNDLSGTVVTFGFDTAVTVATEAIDRLHSTAEAHERVFVVEVMGRYAGWIALHSGVSATADVVLIPGDPLRHRFGLRQDHGSRSQRAAAFPSSLPPKGRDRATARWWRRTRAQGREKSARRDQLRRGAREIQRTTGKETRTVVLGHLQRGGGPDDLRPAPGPQVRRRCGADGGRTAIQRHGRPGSADGSGGASGRGDRTHEVGAARLRHHVDGPRSRNRALAMMAPEM